MGTVCTIISRLLGGSRVVFQGQRGDKQVGLWVFPCSSQLPKPRQHHLYVLHVGFLFLLSFVEHLPGVSRSQAVFWALNAAVTAAAPHPCLHRARLPVGGRTGGCRQGTKCERAVSRIRATKSSWEVVILMEWSGKTIVTPLVDI